MSAVNLFGSSREYVRLSSVDSGNTLQTARLQSEVRGGRINHELSKGRKRISDGL